MVELRDTSIGDWVLGAPSGAPLGGGGAPGGVGSAGQTLALQGGGGGAGGFGGNPGGAGGGGGQYQGGGGGQYPRAGGDVPTYSRRPAYDIATLNVKTGVQEAKDIPFPAIRGRHTRCGACKYLGKQVLTQEEFEQARLANGGRLMPNQVPPHGEWRCGNIGAFVDKWVADHPSAGLSVSDLKIPIENPLEVYAAHRQQLGLSAE